MTIIKTFGGGWIDLSDPDPNQIYIEEIAHSLSNLCRFTGRCDRFYSVADHSILVSQTVAHLGPEMRIKGLLHDASEFLIGDIITPVKNLFPDIRIIEQRLLDAIFFKFGLPVGPLMKVIHTADKLVLSHEVRELMNASDDELIEHWNLQPPNQHMKFPIRQPHESCAAFLNEFNDCMEAWNNAKG